MSGASTERVTDQNVSSSLGAPALDVSVVIPTHNRRQSLLRTLEALGRQTYPMDRFEVVVISDGSSDGTAEAVKDLRTAYSLQLIEQKNAGPAAARNHGARRAKAHLLVFVDDDIEPAPSFLREHVDAHAASPDLVLIGPQLGPMRERMPHWIAWEHLMLHKQYEKFVDGTWEAGPNNLYSGNFSVGREHLLATGGFNERFTRQEDVELGFRLAQRGVSFRFSMRPEAIHRPTRTFKSWYRTPYEYGKRDVQMARDIGEEQALILARKHFRERNRATRIAAKLCVGVPMLEPATLALGRAAVKVGGRKVALVACSLLFNLRYLQGMCEELGGRAKLWAAVEAPEPASAV